MVYRKRYGIPPTWSAPAGAATELHFILDNEAALWIAGEDLRVCGRCGAQTYYDVCPELCQDAHGAPLELHQGHLTNIIATMRAEGRGEEVEDVFQELERLHPYVPPDESEIRWAPDIQLRKAREARERAAREQLRAAEQHGTDTDG